MPADMRSRRKLWALLFGLMFITAGCAVSQSPPITKIALLAPFEGRHRAIGYNALYAVRLALTESSAQNIQLLAVDDGGTVDASIERIRAINNDPSIYAIIVLGHTASSHEVQLANDKPLILVGYWHHTVSDDDTYHAMNRNIITRIWEPPSSRQTEVPQNEMLLQEYSNSTQDSKGWYILTASSLPEEDFRERYINSDLYVPEPNLLATLTYDIANLIIESIRIQVPIWEITYSGINGDIHFEDGYWEGAVSRSYVYRNNELVRR